MDFSEVLVHLKAGKLIKRKNSVLIYMLVDGELYWTSNENIKPAHIGSLTTSDILSEDWEVLK